MRHDFYAYLDRMKYIKRWQLMRSVREENIMEHSQSVTVLAHALVSIHNEVFHGNADVLKTVLYAVYHETSEVMTGDLPTPIKYYNQNIHGAYKQLEQSACEKMVKSLPTEMQGALAKRYNFFKDIKKVELRYAQFGVAKNILKCQI